MFDMIVEGPKLTGEAQAKEDDQYSLDTERGAQLYASFLMTSCWNFCAEAPSVWDILPLRGGALDPACISSKLVSKIG